ncbi:MAG TPA: hypothetical protein VM287_09090 [Egibacteraceae bacterium]|nr:hypothetical protein [Egibacteraceae bacterium]
MGVVQGVEAIRGIPARPGRGLPAERQASWTVTRGGIIDLLARDGSPGGDAAYRVELTVQEDGP